MFSPTGAKKIRRLSRLHSQLAVPKLIIPGNVDFFSKECAYHTRATCLSLDRQGLSDFESIDSSHSFLSLMAPRDSSTSRHRESGTHRKHDRGHRSSRDRSARRPATDSEATSSGAPSSSGQRLSLNALSQLNQYNSTRPIEEPPRAERPRRKKERRPREDDYIIVEPEDESPRVERRRRHDYTDEEREARRAARRERRRREAVTDDEHETQALRKGRTRSRGAAYDSEREREAPRKSRRRKEVVTDSERDVDPQKKDRHLVDADPNDEDQLRWERFKNRDKRKKRVVSGAVVEEGRAPSKMSKMRMRGGAASKHSSYDSVAAEKEELYRKANPPFYKKKKRCKFRLSLDKY